MKKLMVMFVSVAMIASVASAATTSISDSVGTTAWSDGIFFDVSYNTDWSYSHDLTAEYATMIADIEASLAADEYYTNLTLESVVLTISADDVEAGLVSIALDGADLGLLTTSEGTVETNFTVSDVDSLSDLLATIAVTYNDNSNRAIIDWSTLTLTYSYDIEVEEQEDPGTPDTPATVPAPGAVLLGGLGAGLVGWLRRKKSL